MEIRNLCCCCLLRPPDKDLNTPYVFLGVTETVSDLLEECFQIDFTMDLRYDCGVCEVCVGRLRDASDFKLQVQRSQAELQAQLVRAQSVKDAPAPFKLELSDESDDDFMIQAAAKWEMSDDALSERGSSPKPCAVAAPSSPGLVSSRAREQLAMACSVRLERLQHDKMSPRTSPHQSSLTTHMRVHAEQLTERTERRDLTSAAAGAETYTCDTCGKQFARKSSIITHLKKHIANKTPVTKTTLDKVSLNIVKEQHSKTDTQVTSDSREDELQCEIEIQIQAEEKPDYSNVCSKQFKKNHELLNHTCTKTVHKTFHCEVCNKQFKRKFHLTEHARVHAGEKPYSSSVCDKRFVQKLKLNKHTTIHTGEKPYQCKDYLKKFSTKYCFDIHKTVHMKEKPYSCKICDKQFSRKLNYLNHILRHTGRKQYGCDACLKQYSTQSQLRKHQRLHTGKKPVTLFLCDICLKPFKNEARLNDHMTVHTLQTPYACEVCHKKFKRASYLRNHNRVHTGDKPYTCDTCAKQFAHRQGIILHIRMHTGQKPFACEVCCKKFSCQSNLAKHKQRHAGVRPNTSKCICEVCRKEFSDKQRLKVHIQCVHEGLKPYACEVCGMSFGQRCHRNRHQISRHADAKRERD